MMRPLTLSHLRLLLLLSLFHLSTSLNDAAEYLKLTLLHKPPFSYPHQSLEFDTHRLSLLNKTLKSPLISGASSGSGQYFVELRLGSPPQTLLLVADTGSDLVWVKCTACKNCVKHKLGTDYRARQSITFSPHHCYSPVCKLVTHSSRDRHCNKTRIHSPCRYEYEYSDGSKTSGFFSKEVTTLKTSSGQVVKFRYLNFGCAFEISGPSVTGASFNGAHGVLGLGRGPISFSTQLGKEFGNKFSYCLLDYTLSPPPTSFLLIGSTRMTNRNMSFTPLENNPLSPTFYYIAIKHVFVDGVKLPISSSVWAIDNLGNGGTVFDSGTTLTFLADQAYRQILRAFRRRLKLPVMANPTLGFDLCVNVSNVRSIRFPQLRFELGGGAVFSPPAGNYFIDTAVSAKCLAIQPVNSRGGISVIGNLMQQGFLFEFDGDRSRLGFTRHGCSVL
ncbi:Xylanase inhibitor, C-terminal [Dillenia turbinata]|uniref:Xylanase inhibitor, C-terminal n=1 Tax=Dillenia turbinata TaxID=194707 RepID=A0AAN8V6R2_9MAGN